MKYSALQFTEDFMIPYSADFQKQIPVCKDLKEDERIRIRTLFNQIHQESVSNLVNSTAIIQSEIHILLLYYMIIRDISTKTITAIRHTCT